MAPYNYERKIRQALGKDQDWNQMEIENCDENLLKLNRELIKKARTKTRAFNFILRPANWNPKSCSKIRREER
eukprot:Awhi_evm1s1806